GAVISQPGKEPCRCHRTPAAFDTFRVARARLAQAHPSDTGFATPTRTTQILARRSQTPARQGRRLPLTGNRMNMKSSDATILAATKHWLTRAVIGLNLCPFAKSVYVKDQVRYVISRSDSDHDILQELESELLYLAETDPDKIDTTLLILPEALSDFLEYNDFLHRADRVLKRKRLTGLLQIASFHPHYQFSDSEPDAIENFTNRAPYPMLHLLRE